MEVHTIMQTLITNATLVMEDHYIPEAALLIRDGQIADFGPENALDIPTDIATPLFATARLSGWCAHRLEELIAGKKLMRPAYNCVQEHLEYKPIKDRK